MTSTVLLRNIRPWAGAPVDILIHDGVIARVDPHDPRGVAADGLGGDVRIEDGRGLLALPGFVNAHAHVDKSWTGMPWVSYGGVATTQGRIEHERAERGALGIPSLAATTALLRQFVALGTTSIRTHVDVDLGLGLSGIDIVRQAAADLETPPALTVVAFPQDGVLRRPGVLDLLDRAAAAGADAIGGLDPASIDRDPVGQLDALFEIAERRGVELDIHLHDPAELGAFQIELIVDRTRRAGLGGRVNVAHGFAIGQLSPERQRELAQAMGEAGVSMTSVAPVTAAPLPFAVLARAGVRVGLGTDGIRDLWGPFGDGDMLGIARTHAQLARMRHDDDLTGAVRSITDDGAAFVGRTGPGLQPGAVADLVLLDAENVPDALVRVPRRELVVCGGKIVTS